MQRRRLIGKQPPLARPNPNRVTRRLTGKQPVTGPLRGTTGAERIEQVRQVFQELNRPGIARLRTALEARGIRASYNEVASVVQGDESKQLFAPRQRYEGHVTSSRLNERWAADLIDYTAQPSPPYTHILVVQEIFSRKIFARPLSGTSPQEVTAAFRDILSGTTAPKELSTDQGAEFNNSPFPQLLKERNIAHRVKSPQDRNAIATLDRAIQSLKTALSQEDGPWAKVLEKVVRGQNAAPHGHLHGSAPKDVRENKVLQFRLMEQDIDDTKHNEEINQKRAKQLEKDGAYRIEEPVSKFERSFKPRFKDKVHQVERIEGGMVVDEDGQKHPMKFVRAVPAGSAPTEPRDRFVRRGSAQVENRRQVLLRKFADKVAVEIRKAGGTLELWRVGTFLKQVGGFEIASREAGLSQKGLIANFFRVFPRRFKLNIPEAGGLSSVSLISRR